ncbi:MAG: cupredoxin domain-containing protein [Candidatus Sulfotelmatobacter sp.]
MKLKITSLLFVLMLFAAYPAHGQTTPRRIEITAKKFDYVPSNITLKKDEPVVIVLKSMDAAHGLRFRELGFNVRASKGQTSEAEFTPTKTGDFVGQCSVFCGSGHGGMKLTLHVVE